MKTYVNVEVEVETSEITYNVIHGVWVCLPCGKRVVNLEPFLEEDEKLQLMTEILEEA